MSERSGNVLIGVAGALAVTAFFLPFLDLGGMFAVSGWGAVTAHGTSLWTRFVLSAVPLGGLALAISGFAGSRHARWIGATFGTAVLGYLGYTLVRLFIATTGVGLWLVVAAAIAAIVAALFIRRR